MVVHAKPWVIMEVMGKLCKMMGNEGGRGAGGLMVCAMCDGGVE